jgi:hypothetical protein
MDGVKLKIYQRLSDLPTEREYECNFHTNKENISSVKSMGEYEIFPTYPFACGSSINRRMHKRK